MAACILALITSSAVMSWIYVFQYRADEQTSTVVADTVIKSASAGAVSILSYKPETAPADFGAAKAI